MHKVFKPILKTDNLETAYLYSDGHAVCVFSRPLRDLGTTATYIKMSETIGLVTTFAGRIVFSRPLLLKMLAEFKGGVLGASEANVERGSDKTRAANIAVGNISLYTPKDGNIYFNTFPELLSQDFTYQPTGFDATWEKSSKYYYWSGHAVILRCDKDGKETHV